MDTLRRHLLIPVLFLAACGGGGGGGGGNGGGTPGPTTSFATDVFPLLNADCITCHGGAGGLSVENYDNIFLGGDSGPVVIPGDADNSLLIQRLEGTVGDQMPLGLPPLSQPQIDTIRTWINEGALNN